MDPMGFIYIYILGKTTQLRNSMANLHVKRLGKGFGSTVHDPRRELSCSSDRWSKHDGNNRETYWDVHGTQ